ncbi:protein nervous wreck [Daktulosphaira vitifoliae]|uniref:protein nervous wreck n=1 Tax=Daktulosphaira vitifoliae TaxID=58002 RepID=UPI0021A98BC8|nr:protein nervous wreck [Daktulosphaira vitifoliae]
MQPPPRKGNYVKFLKNLHSEQIAKLHLKNQNECDLLEDIRSFLIKKSAIEKSYSDALLKISVAFLNKKIANIPDIKTEGSEEKWNMWNVWRTVLEENESAAKARLEAIELLQNKINDEAKTLRSHKLQIAKKCTDHLAQVQKELHSSVQDVDKTKKYYFDEEQNAHEVRDKAKDIEEKLKKKKGSFFQSITSLQKNSAKVSSRREVLEEKSSGARNDYLLSLAGANAHQTRYFLVDLQNVMNTMENNVYEKVQEYLSLLSKIELITCTVVHNSFKKVKDQAQQLSREYNMQCVYLFYPVLKQHVQYLFEPCDGDSIDHITADHEAVVTILSQEAKRWATRILRETNNIKENVKKLQVFQALRDSGQKNDPNDPNGPDLETKIETLKNSIRRSEIAKVKAEARIECLKNGDGNVNVEEWLADIGDLSIELQRSSSTSSITVEGSATNAMTSDYDSEDYGDGPSESPVPMERHQSSSQDEEERPDSAGIDKDWALVERERQRIEQLTAGWDDPTQVNWEETGDSDDKSTYPQHTQEPEGPVYKCTALYSYSAQHPDELTIVENEQLEVFSVDSDSYGWSKARNYKGEVGYVPSNYLDIEQETCDPDNHDAPTNYQLRSQISFSSVDYMVNDAPLIQQLQNQSDEENEAEEQSSEKSITTVWEKKGGITDTPSYCIALFDYDGNDPEELGMKEGQIIKVIDKTTHIDDGWWVGELGSNMGHFPSCLVKECYHNGELVPTPTSENGDSDFSNDDHPEFVTNAPPPPPPPAVTPPELTSSRLLPTHVIVTQPTPIGEHGPEDISAGVEVSNTNNDFSMELTQHQQEQYDTQFAGNSIENSDKNAITMVPQLCIHNDDNDDHTGPPNVPPPPAPATDGLGVAQIVITAATPVVEEPEKPFGQESSDAETKSEIESQQEPEEEHHMSVDSDYFPATIPEESEDELKLLESDEANDIVLPPLPELEPDQLAKLHKLKESNA